MKIVFYGKKVDLTDQVRDYVETRINKMDRYVDGILEARVELDEDKSMSSGPKYRAEVMLFLPKYQLRATSTGSDIREAIDLVEPKLKKQIETYKFKTRGRD